MFRLTLRSLITNWIRFALTSLAIVLGVSFVTASFIVTDSLAVVFGDLATDVNAGKDLIVRGKVEFGERQDNTAAVPDSLYDEIAELDGVTEIDGQIFVIGAYPVDDEGDQPDGFFRAGINWSDQQEMSQLQMIEGEPPRADDEFVLEPDVIDSGDYVIGQTYTVVTPAAGPLELTLTGAFQFGLDTDASVGAVLTAFEPETAKVVLGYPDAWQEVWVVTEDGATDAVQAEIDALLPPELEVITQEVSQQQFEDDNSDFLGIFRTVLLVFAIIVAFVSAFLIYNTFNIVLGQRVRELGLLRAVGATGRQVAGSVIFESVVVGAAATIVGIGAGYLFAIGLEAMFGLFGFDLPDGPRPLALRTILFAAFVGVGFTVVASIIPAYKASTIPPIAALAEGSGARETTSRGRTIAGSIIGLIGVFLTGAGLFGSFDDVAVQLIALGVGALTIFVAAAVLSPLVAGVASRLLGSRLVGAGFVVFGAAMIVGGLVAALAGLALTFTESPVALLLIPLGALIAYMGWGVLRSGLAPFRLPGRIARKNAAESPQRTATTAIALTIGIALVTLTSTVGTSLKESFAATIDSGVEADFIFQAGGFAGVPEAMATDIDALDELDVVSPGRFGQIRLDDDVKDAAAYRFEDLEELFDLGLVEGSYDPAGIAMFTETTENVGVGLGDEVTIEFQTTDTITLPIVAIYDNNRLSGSVVFDYDTWVENVPGTTDQFVVATITEGVTEEQARAAAETVTDAYAGTTVENREEFLDSQEAQLDQVLAIVNVFLFVSVVIALIGIVNTLTLSVFERTREIGLLRAVGMTRPQTVDMIRWEAAIVALFGAVLGTIIGLLFGYAITVALPDDFIDRTALPFAAIVQFLIISALIGLLAAYFPARRAGRMNVLEAVSHS